jgi:hypothetical protein
MDLYLSVPINILKLYFFGFETDEYNFIFIDWVREPTKIWVVRFDLDRPHIFIGDMAYIHLLTHEYKGHMAAITGPPLFVRRWYRDDRTVGCDTSYGDEIKV